MTGGKKAQKNQKENQSQNNPDILRRKNQENLFQKQLQDHLQRILKYPPEYQGWCRPETYAAYEDTRTMYEKYGVNAEDLATYSEMGLERDSDCPSFDGVPYGRGR